MLYDRGYEEQDILELYNFIDWLMQLPEGLEQQFQVELEQFEEARQMKYVTAIERMAEARGQEIGREEGREIGREEERQDLALGMLQENLPLEVIVRLTGFSIEQLQNLRSQDNP